MLTNSTGFAPAAMHSAAAYGPQACLVVAIGAVGLKTSVRDVASLGWQPDLLLALVAGLLAAIEAKYLHTLHRRDTEGTR